MARPEIREDRPVLIKMAEVWVNGGCQASVRSLAEQFKEELLPAKFTQESFKDADTTNRSVRDQIETGWKSTSKRLQAKFREMVKDGTALQIGTYFELRALRHRYRLSKNVASAPPVRGKLDLVEGSSDHAALSALAGTLSLPDKKVLEVADEGLAILHTWFPNEYLWAVKNL